MICCYTTKVRITVRAGDTITVREGIGTGTGRSHFPEVAHEMGLKAAETDATKRALATFGNPFGLALYDKELSQVTRRPKQHMLAEPSSTPSKPSTGDLVLRSGRHEEHFSDADQFMKAVESAIAAVPTLDALHAFWEANLASFRALRDMTKDRQDELVAGIISALKDKARALGQQSEIKPGEKAGTGNLRVGSLAVPRTWPSPKERRLRDKAHLAFVASQPCLVCGRRPSHAHHLRFAQPRALGLKVSDEFTVPLCNGHHDELHRTGDERAWWARHGIIDPLKFAARLWAASSRQEGLHGPSTVATLNPIVSANSASPGGRPG